ncbi:MAG: hypothetical protein VYD34_02390 [Verrucomicrobiota bacterium]|nr:hypothetical protein [Verrucomicrobiota bacterium]
MNVKSVYLLFLFVANLSGVIAGQVEVPVFDVKQIEGIRAAEGKEIKVRGLVERTGKSKGSGMNFLNFPGGEFTVVVFGRSLKNFPGGEPADIFKGKLVEVTGKVELYKKKPQIVLEEPSRLVVLNHETGKPVAAADERKKVVPKERSREVEENGAEKTVSPSKGKVDPRSYFDDP